MLMLILLLPMQACENGSTPDSAQPEASLARQLVGSWRFAEYKRTLTLNVDGTYTFRDDPWPEVVQSGTWSVDGRELTLNVKRVEAQAVESKGVYSIVLISDEVLTLRNRGGEEQAWERVE
jgi:hypothetical protein